MVNPEEQFPSVIIQGDVARIARALERIALALDHVASKYLAEPVELPPDFSKTLLSGQFRRRDGNIYGTNKPPLASGSVLEAEQNPDPTKKTGYTE